MAGTVSERYGVFGLDEISVMYGYYNTVLMKYQTSLLVKVRRYRLECATRKKLLLQYVTAYPERCILLRCSFDT